MERTVTQLITGLALAPAFYLAGWIVAARMTRGAVGSDSSIAAGYLSLLLGFGFAALGFVMVWVVTRRVLTPGLMRPVQVVDLVLVVGWFFAWNRFMAPTPALTYPGHRVVLEVEARISDSLLAGIPVGSAVSIDFVGGQDLSLPHPDRARSEIGFTVLPWETTPLAVAAWEIRLFLHGTASLFHLALPRRPDASTGWSEWIAPVGGEDSAAPPGLSLRYRFRLVPHGSG